MLQGIKAIVRNEYVIAGGNHRHGQYTALVAEDGEAIPQKRWDPFLTDQAAHVFVHAEISDLITRSAVACDDVTYYFIRVTIHPYGIFVNIFHAL